MRRVSRREMGAFGSAAVGVAVAALLTRACPGGCGTCGSCAAAIVPMGTSLSVVGAVLAVNVRRGKRDAPVINGHNPRAGERDGTQGST